MIVRLEQIFHKQVEGRPVVVAQKGDLLRPCPRAETQTGPERQTRRAGRLQ